jgi:hypothetical protein
MPRTEAERERRRRYRKRKAERNRKAREASETQDTEPDWSGSCLVCGASPIVPMTGMCGPCTFGEAETAGGNW